MADVYDLKLVNRDLAFGPDGEPLFLAGAAAIAQDVKHRLEEKGLTVELVGDEGDTAAVRRRIAGEVEEDLRIRPGTAAVTETAPGVLEVTAQTTRGAPVSATVTS